MDQKELFEYISKSREQGLSDEQIKVNLLKNGWAEGDVGQALKPNKWLAVAMYFAIGLLVFLFSGSRNDPFVKFHFKQGLILLVFSIGIDIIFSVIETPPSFSYLLVESSFYLTVFALLIKGITNAQNGKMRKLPIIGELASYLKF